MNTARELRKYAISHCPKISQKYKDYISIHISDLTFEILKLAKGIYSDYATYSFEIQKRIEKEIDLIELLNSLESEVDLAHETNIADVDEYEIANNNKFTKSKPAKFLLSDNIWKGFIELTTKELALIKGVKTRDKKEYGDKLLKEQKMYINNTIVVSDN